jgi:hypothetical protein
MQLIIQPGLHIRAAGNQAPADTAVQCSLVHGSLAAAAQELLSHASS